MGEPTDEGIFAFAFAFAFEFAVVGVEAEEVEVVRGPGGSRGPGRIRAPAAWWGNCSVRRRHAGADPR
ncbi:hypothetical protein AWH04_03540 [Rhodococcus erythropolis]|nr:hypothetical protein AWH04_03540 [Rhodococcus erythropolis]